MSLEDFPRTSKVAHVFILPRSMISRSTELLDMWRKGKSEFERTDTINKILTITDDLEEWELPVELRDHAIVTNRDKHFGERLADVVQGK
jgi:hypothetical protein